MRKFMTILMAVTLALMLARAVISPDITSDVPIIETLQNLTTMDLPYVDMVDTFTDQYNEIAELLDTVIGDWGGADGFLEYLRVLGLGLWTAIRAIYAVFLAPFIFLVYTLSTIVEILRVLSALLY